jgi:RNA polymerase sigma factor (TIGR02999 family)
MDTSTPQEFTQLLLAWKQGDQAVLDQIIPLVYEELKRLARHYMRSEQRGHGLQTTALVNEAYLRLVDSSRVQWQSRAHFLSVAAQMMRRVLTDLARERLSHKRGGGAVRISLSEAAVVAEEQLTDLAAIHEALEKLEQVNPKAARVVELKFYGGLSGEEIAEVMKITPARVSQHWSVAKAWLKRELSGEGDPADG